jgi:hypothetical protein
MVLYTGLDGLGSFGRCEELPEAVAEVERLRNEQSIEDAQIFRLEEVKFEIKPYFRVEIPGISSETLTPAPAVPVPVGAAADETLTPWSAAAATGSAAAATGSAAAASADVPSMVIPPPPPPPPAPVAPMGYDGGTFATDDDAIVGSRRGLFGR